MQFLRLAISRALNKMKSYYNFVIILGPAVHFFQQHTFHWILSRQELLA